MVIRRDIVILGGGLAGYYCALRAAVHGLKPLLIDKASLGGTGLRTGCLPVKNIMDGIRNHKQANAEGSYWQQPPLGRDQAKSILRANTSAMEGISGAVRKQLEDVGVEVRIGNPKLIGEHQLTLDGETFSFDRLVLATGTESWAPFPAVIDEQRVLTHRGAVGLQDPPESMVIVGGDVEGLEFASMFAELGTQVTVVEALPTLLQGTDEDLAVPLWQRLRFLGVSLLTGIEVVNVEWSADQCRVHTKDGTELQAEKVVLTAARKPVVPDGFAALNIPLHSGRVAVNEQAQTSVPHIYCIGDLNGRLEMGHTAIQQGIFLADILADLDPSAWEYNLLPRAMFTMPQNGGAGLQENELQRQGISYKKTVVPLHGTWRGMARKEPDGSLKLLFSDDNRLIGAWAVGAEISELANILALLVSQRASPATIRSHLWVHPTITEAILEATVRLDF